MELNNYAKYLEYRVPIFWIAVALAILIEILIGIGWHQLAHRSKPAKVVKASLIVGSIISMIVFCGCVTLIQKLLAFLVAGVIMLPFSYPWQLIFVSILLFILVWLERNRNRNRGDASESRRMKWNILS
jgi:hypothetical protein